MDGIVTRSAPVTTHSAIDNLPERSQRISFFSAERLIHLPLPELLGEPYEYPLGTADVSEPIRVSVLDHFADDRRAALAESGERVVEVVHGEHDAEVAEGIHRG